MVFRFDNFAEKWAAAYKPLSHEMGKNAKRKTFFRHDSLDEKMDIAKNLVGINKADVFMSVITAFDGELIRASENAPKPNFYSWHRHVLFWVKSSKSSKSAAIDEISAAEAKARGVELATDFISFLDYCADPRRGNMKEIAGIDFDSVEIATLPVEYNGWWITVINFRQDEPREKCIVDEKYDDELVKSVFDL